ncbi:hypothetical protein FACS189498_3760 [Spirochaetia bacterium]|nr:hypothetical protein FACS189498_3760 [Spirochaetia bacterium]
MPSQILHTLFGEDVIVGLHQLLGRNFGIIADKALEKVQDTYKTAFSLGCQGPDIFYHSRTTRPVALEYGSLLHRRGYGVFTAALLQRALPEKGINALGAYALGFMTHALLDRAAHPYIVYKTGPSPRLHTFFERILDTLMWEKLRGGGIFSWDQTAILARTCEKPPLGLKELIADSLVRSFPERTARDGKINQRIENAFYDCAVFYRVTDPAASAGQPKPLSEAALSCLYPENLPNEIDYLNLEKKPWFHPSGGGAGLRLSFPEIYAETVDSAVSTLAPVITHYLSSGIFPIKEAARAIGNGGLSIVDTAGKPCIPVIMDPLPLGEVLEGQGRMRG